MGIPIVFSSSERIERSGKTFEAPCGACKRVVKMYEGVRRSNVSVYIAISLWDDVEPIVQCGECLGIYTKDNPPPRPSSRPLPPPSGRRAAIDEASIDAELAALKKKLGE